MDDDYSAPTGPEGGGAFGFGDDALGTDVVDVGDAGRRVWLVRVPDYVYERLADVEAEGHVDEAAGDAVGAVRVVPGAGPGDAPQVLLTLAPGGPCGDLPGEYVLRLSRCAQAMHVFSADAAQGSARALVGRVEQECAMQPVLSESYRRVLRGRAAAAGAAGRARRGVCVLDDGAASDLVAQAGLVPHVRERDLLAARRRRADPDLRRERLPRDAVTDMVFRAFERAPHWTFRALCDHTQQPSAYLKEVLADVALYLTRGPFKNTYELRPEYRRAGA